MNIEAKQPKSPTNQMYAFDNILNEIKEKGFTISEVLYIFNEILDYLVSEEPIK